jgi:hypothetical protein
LTACGSAPSTTPKPASTSEAEAPATTATIWPEGLVKLGDGYPKPGDACRRVGESPLTSNYLDDSAILVGCPGTADDAESRAIVADRGGKVVGTVSNVTLLSIPQGDANVGLNATPDVGPKNESQGRTAK